VLRLDLGPRVFGSVLGGLLVSSALSPLHAQLRWPASNILNPARSEGASSEIPGLVSIQEIGRDWSPVVRDGVYDFDRRLKVDSPVSLHVKLDYELDDRCRYEGNLTFLTDSRPPDSDLEVTEQFFEAEPLDSALYFLGDENGVPTVEVEEGSLIVFWKGSCPLDVYWTGSRIPINGTEVLLQTYRGGDSTMVFVREGEIAVRPAATTDSIVAEDGDFVLLRSDGTAVLLGTTAATAVTAQASREVSGQATRYHGERVWQGWFSRQASSLLDFAWSDRSVGVKVGVATVGVGVATWGIVELVQALNGSDERTVALTVRLPFS
jgi:hypothetical protein